MNLRKKIHETYKKTFALYIHNVFNFLLFIHKYSISS
jgi:hypothetical protein